MKRRLLFSSGLLFYNLNCAVFFILHLLLVNRLSLYDLVYSSCRASGFQISESVYYQSKLYNRDAKIKVNSQNPFWNMTSCLFYVISWQMISIVEALVIFHINLVRKASTNLNWTSSLYKTVVFARFWPELHLLWSHKFLKHCLI